MIKTPAFGALLLAVLLAVSCGSGAPEDNPAATHRLVKGDLRMTLTESGTLEARFKTSIRPQIKTGAKILSIVDEGTLVKAGDVLVELDKESVQREIEDLEDRVIQLEADLKNARTDLEIQKGENESAVEKAALALEFAEKELERYEQGDHPQALRDRELKIDQADSRLKQARDKYAQMPRLLEEGFVTPIELEEKKLAFESAQVELESARLDLELYEKYTHPMTLRQKKADVIEAQREQKRVVARAEAREEAKVAVVRQKDRQYEAAVAKLEEARAELAHLTITAPQDGIVIYGGERDRRGNMEQNVKVGETAFPGRTLIELPDLTMMNVNLQVHQADVGKLRKGLTAWISLPGRSQTKYRGTVTDIGSVAQSQSWRDPIRRFDVVVQIEDRVQGLRAGITVEVEIDLGEIGATLFVPLQAVSSSGSGYFVFLKDSGGVKKRRVRLGVANEQFVQVLEGLAEGDEILLVNPEVAAEEEEQESGGGEERPGAGGAPAGGNGAGQRPGSRPR